MLTISHEDIIKSGGFNIPQAIEVTQRTLQSYAAERILYPDKVSQILMSRPRIVSTACQQLCLMIKCVV